MGLMLLVVTSLLASDSTLPSQPCRLILELCFQSIQFLFSIEEVISWLGKELTVASFKLNPSVSFKFFAVALLHS